MSNRNLVSAADVRDLVFIKIATTINDAHAELLSSCSHVIRLMGGQCRDALFQCFQRELLLPTAFTNPHTINGEKVILNIRARNEILRGNVIQSATRAAHALISNDGSICAALGACLRGFVASGATAADNKALLV